MLFLLLCVLAPEGIAQHGTVPADTSKKLWVAATPGIGNAPETGFSFGLFAQSTLAYWADSITRVSTIGASFEYTERNQWITAFDWDILTRGEKYWIQGFAELSFFPELFFGLGSRTPSEGEPYESRRFQLEVEVRRLVDAKRRLFIGPILDYLQLYDLSFEPEGILEGGSVPGSRGGASVGLGASLSIDTRNSFLHPRQGHFYRLDLRQYSSAWGSDFGFTKLLLELRWYRSFGFGGRGVAALQVRQEYNWGNVPFLKMTTLGSEDYFRGYYQGRFRDHMGYSMQAEYRFPLFWRLGLVTFVGLGDVGRTVADYSLPTIKPIYGLGGRFNVLRRQDINVGVDVAFTPSSGTAFYVHFGEAF